MGLATGHWLAWVGGCGGPMTISPVPGAASLTPVAPPPLTPPLQSQTQQEAGPGFAQLGTSPQVGAWSWEGLCGP